MSVDTILTTETTHGVKVTRLATIPAVSKREQSTLFALSSTVPEGNQPFSGLETTSTTNIITSTSSGGKIVYKTRVETQYVTNTPATNTYATKTPGTGRASSLSSGDIAGVVIGVLGAIALVACLAWFLLRRRRTKRQDNTIDQMRYRDVDESAAKRGKVEIGAAELHDEPVLFEARDGERYEMPTRVSELEGSERFVGAEDITKDVVSAQAGTVAREPSKQKKHHAPWLSRWD